MSPLSLLGNYWVNTFPRQRRIFGGVVFYEIHVVSKESRRLILTNTCCLRGKLPRKLRYARITVSVYSEAEEYEHGMGSLLLRHEEERCSVLRLRIIS
jgi:hypothetical protein